MYFNERALADSDFATNFAMLFSSKHFNDIRQQFEPNDGTNIFRAHILNMLQENYSSVYFNLVFGEITVSKLDSNLNKCFPIADAEHLKVTNIEHFYNSITLLGEFYNHLHQKTHPILIMGSSLFKILTKQLQNEFIECTNDETHVLDVAFTRLLLAQVMSCTAF